MSERSKARKVQAETGLTYQQALQRVRASLDARPIKSEGLTRTMGMRKFSIGEVGFGSPCPKEQNSAGWRCEDGPLGKPRVELLQKARAGAELPDGWFLVGQIDGGRRRITADEVDWDGLDFYLQKARR